MGRSDIEVEHQVGGIYYPAQHLEGTGGTEASVALSPLVEPYSGQVVVAAWEETLLVAYLEGSGSNVLFDPRVGGSRVSVMEELLVDVEEKRRDFPAGNKAVHHNSFGPGVVVALVKLDGLDSWQQICQLVEAQEEAVDRIDGENNGHLHFLVRGIHRERFVIPKGGSLLHHQVAGKVAKDIVEGTCWSISYSNGTTAPQSWSTN